MKYKIWCNQRGQYFADESEFESLEEIKNQLVDYHETDMDIEDKNKLHKMPLSEILDIFEWEVHDENDNFVSVEV